MSEMYSVTQVTAPYFNVRGKIPQGRIEGGITRGNEVHRFCTTTALDEWCPKPLLYEGFCDSFLWWKNNYVEEVILVEQRLEDKVLGFFGHPDLIVRIKGNPFPCVVDLKTPATKSKLWRSQIAAYTYLAIKNGYGPTLSKGGSLRLKSNGGHPKFDYYDYQQSDFAAFVSLLNWTRWLNE